MAAPNEAYQSYSIKNKFNGNLRATFKMAKFTSPYTTVAEAKALFRLDGVLKEGTSSFVGYVTPNSINAQYHVNSRIDSIIFSSYRLLYDGGLNRLAESQLISVTNTSATDHNDPVSNYPPTVASNRLFYWLYSPLYNPIGSSVFQYSLNGVDWTTFYTLSSMAANSQTTNAYLDNLPIFDVAGIYYIKLLAINDEGTMPSNIYTTTINYASEIMKYNAANASDAYNGSASRLVYRNNRNYIAYDNGANFDATRLYKYNSGLSVFETADTGFYVIGTTWYKFGLNVELDNIYTILETGNCAPGGYPGGDPGNIVTTYGQVNCSGFDRDSQEVAELEVTSGNYDYRTIYLETIVNYEEMSTTQYAYSDAGHTTFSGQGYYVVGNSVEGISRILEVNNSGLVVSDIGNL